MTGTQHVPRKGGVMLAVNHIDPAQAPLLLPTHFSLAGSEILLHLARPNGGVRPRIQRVEATFNYDDHNPVEHRERVIGNLEQRDRGLDPGRPPSSDGAWPPSVSGAPAALSPEHRHVMRPKALVGGLPGSAGAYRAVDPVGS